jgi:SAM-dependent methyltransferase
MFADLCASLWALSALRVAADSDLLAAVAKGDPRRAGLHPEATDRILAVLAAYEIVTRTDDGWALTPEGNELLSRGEGLRADLAATFGQTRALVEEARRGDLAPGWRHVDPEVIRAQAGLSYEMSHKMIGAFAELWPELGKMFAVADSRHLDVGVGAAGGAIALCERFPRLCVVGIDPHRAAHLEARANVAAHGMKDRIELRLQGVEQMTDESTFHTAFVASKFFPREILSVAFEKIHRALVPGGCAFLGGWRDSGDPRRAPVSRLREHLWGGSAVHATEVIHLLERAGFSKIKEGPARGELLPVLAIK